jgi:endonuclease YncB( thermonuclease family)
VTTAARAVWPRTYPASVISVIDGDTIIALLDRGGDDYWRTDLRLNGGNAREHNQPGGPEATAHMRQLVDSVLATTIASLFSFPAQVVSLSWDKFGGRIDGSLIVPGVGDVMQAMIRDGYAAVWDGRGTRPVPPWPIPGTG